MNNHKLKSQNWGSAFLRTKISREPYLLQKKTLQDLKYWEWIFIVISVLGVLNSMGFNIYQLTMNLINKERYLFPILLIVSNLFAIYFLFIGILQELPYQILMQLITKATVWLFNMIYYLSPNDPNPEEVEDETQEEIKAIRFYISSSFLFLTIPVGAFVLYQYWISNISLFKTVGTEPKYVNMCKTLYLGQSLIGLDVEITIIALILLASKGLSSNDLFALIVLPLGLVLTGLWACLGVIAMKRESRFLTYMFYIASHLHPLYVIYLFVRSSKDSVGPLLFYTLVTVGIMFFLIHIGLLITVVQIQMNYGKGLKQAADKEYAKNKSLAQSLAGSAEFLDHERVRPRPIETDI